MWEQGLIVPWFAVHAVRKHGDHDFIGLLVKVMDFVALIQDIGHNVRRWSVGNGRRNDIGHVTEILVLGEPLLRI